MPIKTQQELAAETNDLYRTGAYSSYQKSVQESAVTKEDIQGEAPKFFTELLPAMFEEENMVTSMIKSETLPFTFTKHDPDYYAFDDLGEFEGSPYEDLLLEAKNADHMAALKKRAVRARENDELITQAPLSQRLIAGLAAGIVSPEILIPGGAIVKTAKGGVSVAKTAAVGAGSAAGAMTVSEAGLRLSQPDRTGIESAINIGAGAVLGGFLGSAAGIYTKVQYNTISKKLMKELSEIAEPENIYIASKSGDVAKKATSGGMDAGAASSKMTIDELTIDGKLAQYYSKVFSKIPFFRNPFNIVMNASSVKAREMYVRMLDIPVKLKASATKIIPQAAEVERNVAINEGALWLKEARKLYKEYKKVEKKRGAKPMTIGAFMENVDYATRNNDIFEGNEFITKAAQLARKNIYEKYGNEAVSVKLIDEENLQPRFAETYAHRVWSTKKLQADPDGAIEMLKKPAKNILDAEIENINIKISKLAKKKKLTDEQADQLADLRRLLDDMGDDYLDEVAEAIYSKLTNGEDTQPYMRIPIKRGPLKEKLLDVDDNDARPFLENRADIVVAKYTEQIGSEIALARAFGETPDLKNAYQEVLDDYAKLIKEAAEPKQRAKLQRERDSVLNTLRSTHAMMRGTFKSGLRTNPMMNWLIDDEGFANQARTAIKDWVYMSTLGGVTESSIPDLARAITVHGISRTFGDISSNFVTKMRGSMRKMDKEELEALGFNAEVELGGTLLTMSDIADPLTRGTALTKTTGKASELFSRATFINEWNNIVKNLGMRVTQTRVLRALQSAKMSRKDNEYLNYLGIDQGTRETIKRQVEKHGKALGYRRYSGIASWDDTPEVRAAARLYKNALRKEGNTIVVTKSFGDIPVWANVPGLDLVFQLKSYVWAANQRVTMRALSDRDMGAVLGVTAMLGLGMLVRETKGAAYRYGRELAGAEVKDREESMETILLDAFDRSGVAAMLMTMNKMSGDFGGPSIEGALGAEPPSRYRQMMGRYSTFGPWTGIVLDGVYTGATIAGDLATGESLQESDIRKFRRSIPFQNVIGLKHGFDLLEGQAVELLDAK